MDLLEDKRKLWIAAAALVLVVVAAQALAAISTPPGGSAPTGRVLGRTGFAYLGGLRTFAAAVLWNRIEPQFHEYYDGVPITEQTYMVPTLRLVVALDPQFTQAYYISSYIVFRRSAAEGLRVAQEAVDNNPKSGILHANLAQLLFISDKATNRQRIVENAKSVLSPGAVWQDEAQRYEGTAVVREALTSLGEQEAAQQATRIMDTIRLSGAELGDHDHDSDGEQDH